MLRRRPRKPQSDQVAIDRLKEPSSAAALVPVPKFDKPDSSVRGGVPLGTLLQNARRRVMMSEASASSRLRIGTHELLDFESGMRTPSNGLIELMAEVYGTTTDRLQSDAGIAVDDPEEPTELTVGWATIDLEGANDAERLKRIATTFRGMRNIADDAPVSVRDDEVVHLARVVQSVDASLIDAFIEHFGVDRQRATELVARMSYHAAAQKELNAVPASIEMGPTTSVDAIPESSPDLTELNPLS